MACYRDSFTFFTLLFVVQMLWELVRPGLHNTGSSVLDKCKLHETLPEIVALGFVLQRV
jgi:hypothetical protein